MTFGRVVEESAENFESKQPAIPEGEYKAVATTAQRKPTKTVDFCGRLPLSYVFAKNLARRHLNASQRAIIAANFCQLSRGKPLENKDETVNPQICDSVEEGAKIVDSLNLGNCTQAQAAKAVNVSRCQVENASKLLKIAPPEIIEQVEQGKKTIHAALKEVGQPVPGKDGKIRPLKYQPRKKTVAKTEEPEEEHEGDFLKLPLPLDSVTMFKAFVRKFKDESEEIREQVIGHVKFLADIIDNLND